jgi:hypothetical protein
MAWSMRAARAAQISVTSAAGSDACSAGAVERAHARDAARKIV